MIKGLEMSFWERFRPDFIYYQVEEITIAWLKKENVKYIFLDVDNTITGWAEKTVPDSVAQWLEKILANNIKVILISNSGNKRLQKIAAEFSIKYISWAAKPSKRPFAEALKYLDCLNKQEVLVIGDQLFTDIWGGNKMGLKTLLVTPRYQKEFFYTKIIRKIERKVLKILQISKKDVSSNC